MSDDEFPGAPTDLDFWSLEIPPGKTVEAKIVDMSGVFEIVHITGCALGEKATNDRHVIKAIPHSVEGKQQGEVALGTLQAGRTDQFALDFGISRTTGFRHTGKSSVWLSGYLTRSFASDFGSDEDYSEDDSDEEDEEEESDEDSESDDEEAPAAVPLAMNGTPAAGKGKGKQTAAAAAAAAAAEEDSESEEEGESDDDEENDEDDSDDEGENDSDDEGEREDGEEEEGDEYDRRLGAKSFDMGAAGGSNSSGDEEGSDDEDEEDEQPGDPLELDSEDLVAGVEYDEAAAAAVAGPQAMDIEGASSEDEGEEADEDEDEDEDDEDEEDEEEDEAEESEEEGEEAPQPAAAGKRPAQPLTPQPAQIGKRQKGEAGQAVAQSAPAKGPQAKTAAAAAGSATPGNEQEFMKQLVAELRKGPSTLNALAAKVKRPPTAPKYKAFLTQHPGTFNVDGENVSLVKGA